MKKLKILFTTPVLRNPPVGGPFLHIENSIKALSELCDLYICSRVSLSDMGGREAFQFYKKYAKEIFFVPSVSKRSIVAKIKHKMFFKKSEIISDKEDAYFVKKLINNYNVDVLWLGYGNISYPFLKSIKEISEIKSVCASDSVWSKFLLRGLPYAEDDAEKLKILKSGEDKEIEEKWGTELSDITTAVSEIDAEYYRMCTENPKKVFLFSNVIDVNSYIKSEKNNSFLKKPSIYLSGSFYERNCPMEDAVRWFLSEIFPIIKNSIPDLTLYIVGNGSDVLLSDINQTDVVISGLVPSVLPYLHGTDAVVVPLRFESGTRFKILEAGACGKPVISTTLGAEGISVANGKDILLADNPDDFAQAVINVIKEKDLASKISSNLKALIEKKYSISSLKEEASKILDYISKA